MVYNALIKMYLYQGLNDKARELIKEAKDRFPESPNFNLLMVASYIQENKFELALSELDRGIEIDPLWPQIWSQRGYVFYFMEDFEAAEKEFRKLTNWEEPGVRAKGRWDIINLYLIQGRFEDALSQIRLAIEEQEVFDPGIFFLNIIRTYLMMGKDEEALGICEIEGWSDFFNTISKGLIYARMKAWGKVDDAVIQVEQILQDEELDYREAWRRHYVYLLGKIEFEKGNFRRAIEHFEQAKSTIPALHYVDYWLGVAFFVEPLAMAYYHAGDLDAARVEFESILSMTEGRLYYGDVYAKAFYMLGKIHEQQGSTAKAIEHYEKFLDLWI
jgi:tetratricopeptide (TPR) repeat protein